MTDSTDSIDLDDLEAATDEEEPDGNDGDWFWSEGGDRDPSTPEPGETATGDPASVDDDSAEGDDDSAQRDDDSEPEAARSSVDEVGGAVPHVPRETKDRPVGIPIDAGGAGGGPGGEVGAEPAEADGDAAPDASGPHGRDADDMTLALTYEAAKRLANPSYAFADAAEWADWVGMIGDVPAHVLNKFQRETTIDLDFFNGSGTGPRERLAEMDHHSMFYAERFVLVGVEGEEAWTPEDWEFVPLQEAAGKADWELE